jgi:hypothetical protein
MHPGAQHLQRKVLEYDSFQKRLWIFGQRCHHGATGLVVAAAACAGLIADRDVTPAFVALAATGGILMAHDWKDHTIWFERGHGTQPIRLLAHASYTRRSTS